MATGDPVVQIIDDSPPATLAAQVSVRTGGSTPAERVVTWNFDGSGDGIRRLQVSLDKIRGWRVDVPLAVVGSFCHDWRGAMGRLAFVAWPTMRRTSTPRKPMITTPSPTPGASASGELSYPTIAFTNGADMDSWADGEIAIVRVRRLQNHADDNMAGDAELWGLFGRET